MSKNAFAKHVKSILSYFNLNYMHVRISERGRRVLNNKALADKVVDAIQANKRKLEQGESVIVDEDGERVAVKFVTTMKTDNSRKK